MLPQSNHVDLLLPDYSSAKREFVDLPLTFSGKFKVLPHFPFYHTFQSVRELLDVYPALGDVIMPTETFRMAGSPSGTSDSKEIVVAAWERLKIFDKVVDLVFFVALFVQ